MPGNNARSRLVRAGEGARRMGRAGANPTPADTPEVRGRELAPPFQIRVTANLVTVRVVVRDGKGRPVGGLRKEDFRLFASGAPHEITCFAVEAAGPERRSGGAGCTSAPHQNACEPPTQGLTTTALLCGAGGAARATTVSRQPQPKSESALLCHS